MIFMRKNNFKQGLQKRGRILIAGTLAAIGAFGNVGSFALHAEEIVDGDVSIAQYSSGSEYLELQVKNNYVVAEKPSESNNWHRLDEAEFLAKIGVWSDGNPVSHVFSNFYDVVRSERAGTYHVLITGYDSNGNVDKIVVTVVITDPKRTVVLTEGQGEAWEYTEIITGHDFVVHLSDMEELDDFALAEYAGGAAWSMSYGQMWDASHLVMVYPPMQDLYPDVTPAFAPGERPTTPGVYDVMLIVYGNARMNMLVKMYVVE
jgi:hypothetical protein